jgi:hypothetical protein
MTDGTAKTGPGQQPDKKQSDPQGVKHPMRVDHDSKPPQVAGDGVLRRGSKGRPRIGLGAVRVQATLERDLLKRVDAYAARHGITRSQMIARGLERILSE